jgi:hypothetical protein
VPNTLIKLYGFASTKWYLLLYQYDAKFAKYKLFCGELLSGILSVGKNIIPQRRVVIE